MRHRAPRTALCAVLASLAYAPPAAHAQQAAWDRLLPAGEHFRPPVADPLEPRFSAGLLSSDILSRQGPERPPFQLTDPAADARETVAAVALGLTFPIAALAEWEGGGLALTGHAAVHSRFRIQYPSRDDMGQDWVVGGGLAASRDALSGRLRIHHRSSHLGDEFMEATGARRIEFGGEAIEGLAAYTHPAGLRLYGGGSWIFHSMTAHQTVLAAWGRDDRYTVQAGGDGEWAPWKNGRLGVNAGVDWQAAQRTSWRGQFSAAAGVFARNAAQLGFSVRYFTGPSTMGEFFLTDETYWSLELTGRF